MEKKNLNAQMCTLTFKVAYRELERCARSDKIREAGQEWQGSRALPAVES